LLYPLLCPLLGLFAAACSSTGGAHVDASEDVRLSFRDYRSGIQLVLINDRYLVAQGVEGATFKERRAGFYSVARSGTLPKVLEDEAMKPTVDYFLDQGFSKYAQAGTAPEQTSAMGASLEIQIGGRSRFMHSYKGMGEAELRTFSGLVKDFIALHGEIRQYQSVEGALEFEQPGTPGRD
jgi:hypothetical protein